MEPRLYEAMFIIDAAKGGSGFPAVIQHISGLLQRYGATVERIEKWAESRLVYKIRQVERGIYVLVYFRAEPGRIGEMRNAINLSEDILRVLILKADRMPEPKGQVYTPEGEPVAVQAPAPQAAVPQPAAEPAPAVQAEAAPPQG